jgi:hypothetical protein
MSGRVREIVETREQQGRPARLEGVCLRYYMWRMYGSRIARPKRKLFLEPPVQLHPGVDYLLNKGHGWYVGGRVEGLQLPTITISGLFGLHRRTYARSSSLGWRRSSGSRRAIRCIAHTWN